MPFIAQQGSNTIIAFKVSSKAGNSFLTEVRYNGFKVNSWSSSMILGPLVLTLFKHGTHILTMLSEDMVTLGLECEQGIPTFLSEVFYLS